MSSDISNGPRITCEPFDSDVLSGFGAVVAKYAPNLEGKPLNFQILDVTSTGFGSAKWQKGGDGDDQHGCVLSLKITLGANVSDDDYKVLTDQMIEKQAREMATRMYRALGGTDDGLH